MRDTIRLLWGLRKGGGWGLEVSVLGFSSVVAMGVTVRVTVTRQLRGLWKVFCQAFLLESDSIHQQWKHRKHKVRQTTATTASISVAISATIRVALGVTVRATAV